MGAAVAGLDMGADGVGAGAGVGAGVGVGAGTGVGLDAGTQTRDGVDVVPHYWPC